MSNSVRVCQIPGNSDIAGIGVRTSVYIQACLAGFNLLYLLHTRLYHGVSRTEDVNTVANTTAARPTTSISDVITITPTSQQNERSLEDIRTSDDELYKESFSSFVRVNQEYINLAKSLERGLFMVGFAVILSAILEARTTGLSPYHAIIVLNVSQINNWAGFVLLLARGGFRPSTRNGWATQFLVTRDSLTSSVPCYIHAAMMSGLGLYFWSNLQPFLAYGFKAEQPCQPVTYFWLFGAIEVSNRALRISSLVFYAISAVPVIGLYLFGTIIVFVLLAFVCVFTLLVFLLCVPAMIFALLYYLLIHPIITLIIRPLFRTSFVQKMIAWADPFTSFSRRCIHSIRLNTHSHTAALLVGPSYSQVFTFPLGVIFCAPLVYAIVSTELTIRVNKANIEPEAENKWTYGQTLALFTALVTVVLYVHELGKMIRKWRKKVKKIGKKAETQMMMLPTEKLREQSSMVDRDTQTEDNTLDITLP